MNATRFLSRLEGAVRSNEGDSTVMECPAVTSCLSFRVSPTDRTGLYGDQLLLAYLAEEPTLTVWVVAVALWVVEALAVRHQGAPLARFRSLTASLGFCCATSRPWILVIEGSVVPTGPLGLVDRPGLVSKGSPREGETDHCDPPV